MYIVDYKRTPVGKFLGSLSLLSAPMLTEPIFRYFFKKYPFLVKQTDEVILGNVLSAGVGLNPARIASVSSGIDISVPSYTINHACASGMNAIVQGVRSIKLGEANLILAGGMESMSNAPHLLNSMRRGKKFGEVEFVDSIKNDGLYCSLSNALAGELSELLAKKYAVSREEQDKYAFNSHTKAFFYSSQKQYKKEVIQLPYLSKDEGIRHDSNTKLLSDLKPVFSSSGCITAGNSSPLSDGAAIFLLASQKGIDKFKLKPKAEIIDAVSIGIDPKYMGMGPVSAINLILKRNNLRIKDIDVFEINEAFAVQVLSVIKKIGLDEKKVNVNGGAIAIGHPLGMSGARIIGSLISAMKVKKSELGIASLCVGGGQGYATLIKNI